MSLRSRVSEPRPLPRLGSPPPSLLSFSSSPIHFLGGFSLLFRLSGRQDFFALIYHSHLRNLTSSSQFDAHSFHPGQRERERERTSQSILGYPPWSTESLQRFYRLLLGCWWDSCNAKITCVVFWICIGWDKVHWAFMYRRHEFVFKWCALHSMSCCRDIKNSGLVM